jgi:hypothetical protein
LLLLQAVDRLKLKYSTDRKQQIRLDKIKDEIMDLRLKQRMSKQSPRAGGVMQAEEAERFLAARGKKKVFVIPAWTKGWILLPNKDYIGECFYTFGMLLCYSNVSLRSYANRVRLCSALRAVRQTELLQATLLGLCACLVLSYSLLYG